MQICYNILQFILPKTIEREIIVKELFTIGQMSRLFATKISTLRYYDEIGLLKPAYTDSNSGYRYYSTPQFERLNTIKYLRALDIPLEKIAGFFDSKDLFHLLHLLEEQQQLIRQQIQKLQRIDCKLQSRLLQIADAADSTLEEIQQMLIPPREVAFLRKEISIQDNLEYPIRELERMNQLEPVMFLGKVGLLLSQQTLQQQQFGQFSGIFVFIEQEDNYRGITLTLPGSYYLTIRFSGMHSDAAPYYQQLLNYVEEHNWQLNGDAVEITLIDAGITNNPHQYVTEIQLPVWKASS